MSVAYYMNESPFSYRSLRKLNTNIQGVPLTTWHVWSAANGVCWL